MSVRKNIGDPDRRSTEGEHWRGDIEVSSGFCETAEMSSCLTVPGRVNQVMVPLLQKGG